MSTIIQQLNWRYATKQYDSTKKVSPEDLEILKEAIRLAPSSYGLQPYKVMIIETAELRAKLREKSWNQPQITDASHIFVFASRTHTHADHVDHLIDLTSVTRGISKDNLEGYGTFMKGAISGLSEEDQLQWNAKQSYIALGVLVTTAATLNIDVTPMEGFDKAGYTEVLGLDGYHPAVVAAVGYRSEEDALQHAPKVRKSAQELFEVI